MVHSMKNLILTGGVHLICLVSMILALCLRTRKCCWMVWTFGLKKVKNFRIGYTVGHGIMEMITGTETTQQPIAEISNELRMNSLQQWINLGGSLKSPQKDRRKLLRPYHDGNAAKSDGFQFLVIYPVSGLLLIFWLYFFVIVKPHDVNDISLALTASPPAPLLLMAASGTPSAVAPSTAAAAAGWRVVSTAAPTSTPTVRPDLFLPTVTPSPSPLPASTLYLSTAAPTLAPDLVATLVPVVRVQVVKDFQNLRSCASFRCDVVGTADRGVQFQALGLSGDWVSVVNAGRIVWINWRIAWLSDYAFATPVSIE